MNVDANITPMMKQYWDAKKAHPDAILLFRMGDFYEMFHEDAKTAARVLNLTLTSRDKGKDATPMAGFPHHQVDAYVGKLIAAGFCAAVCEQVEDPKLAKGLVKREVLRVVTPGTLTEDTLLDPRENNYLAAVVPGEVAGVAWVELSTGQFYAAGFPNERLLDQLARIHPRECLTGEKDEPLPGWLTEKMRVTRRPAWASGLATAKKELMEHFGVLNLEGFGFSEKSPADTQALRAAGVVLDYLKETQKGSLAHVSRLMKFHLGSTLEIDEASRRSLEIVRTLHEGRREGSLLAVLDKTITSPGSRQLSEWVAAPLTDKTTITLRQEAVAELLREPDLCRDVREMLRGVQDLQRLISRVTTGRASPRDLKAIGMTLSMLPGVKAKIRECESPLLQHIQVETDPCPDLAATLAAAVVDEPPISVRDGGIIREGYNETLDELRELITGGKTWITRYQAREQEKTGIPNLKVGFNKVFGYYMEISHTHGEKIPANYIRKQTVKNAERYITEELKEYEEKVLTADEKAKQLEYEIFNVLRETTLEYRQRMQATAQVLAELDVLASFAELARQRNYCRPEIVTEPVLEIAEGRHPVLDVTQPSGAFVPNDVACDPEAKNIMLITGPNMAGKSTYIRQVALLTLMAQIGSFIPAKSAKVGIVDRIFARVGASDELSRGQSTFMVEMTETARILNTATTRSLVILDEIGRGTSTYDGISLAWAILEHIHHRIRCRTLFATHYHELTDLAQSLHHIQNLNVAVREWADEVVFLHKIVPGAADKSYGIHVARLAGVPVEVVERAKTILAELEDEHLDAHGRPRLSVSYADEEAEEDAPGRKPRKTDGDGYFQLTLFSPQDHPLLDEIRELDADRMTPMQALEMLYQWRERLRKE